MVKRKLLAAGCAAAVFTMLSCENAEDIYNAGEISSTQNPQINGVLDQSEAHKAVVALGRNSSLIPFCTGTLVHKDWIVTAAHCIVNDDAGKKQISLPDWAGFGMLADKMEKYPVADGAAFELYGGYSVPVNDKKFTIIGGDIAVLKLKNSVPESVAKPIPLLPDWLAIDEDDLPVETEHVGFGLNEEARMGGKLTIKLSTTEYCPSPDDIMTKMVVCPVGELTIGKNVTNDPAFESTPCAYGSPGAQCHPAANVQGLDYHCYCGYKQNIAMPGSSLFYSEQIGGPCHGDSGGPLFVKIGGVEYVAGVTSSGDPTCGFYGISTATYGYNSWIKKHAPEVFTVYREVCGNDTDDDGDGKTDCADPDCADDPACRRTEENCDNRADDDGDGKTDCADPDCADDPACKITPEICGNKIDDDGDGKTDCADPDCAGVPECSIKPETCDNRADDDGDGKIDCADPDCVHDPACQITAEICNNEIDDDGDGEIDCRDSDCENHEACQSDTEICDNHKDDDGDGDVDCDDAECKNADACKTKKEICNNEIDDDGDGDIDCKDRDCKESSLCRGEWIEGEICDNARDDDGDGDTDCADSDCSDTAFCEKGVPAVQEYQRIGGGCSLSENRSSAPMISIFVSLLGLLCLRRRKSHTQTHIYR